jgi:hypothetical protein
MGSKTRVAEQHVKIKGEVYIILDEWCREKQLSYKP